MPASREQIDRINELSQLARTAWFSLLGYLVFVGITLLGVKDADFFVPSRQTDLPLVGVQIPTASFFWTAPILGAALYTYLHLFLIKLWDAHAEARTTDADATHHWLVGDFVLVRQGDAVTRARSLSWLVTPITVLLVWAAGPVVLGYAWWRSMPAHNEVLTLLIAACFWITLVVGFTSWWHAMDRLGRLPPGHWSRDARIPAAGIPAVVLVVLSWLAIEARPPLVHADLTSEVLVAVPADWRGRTAAKGAFRETWCRREGIAMDACAEAAADNAAIPLVAARQGWCDDHGKLQPDACKRHFEDVERRFAAAWKGERTSAVQALPDLDLTGRDLRGASFFRAFMPGADLRWAQMEGTNVSGAQMEGADLSGAQMKRTNLSWAQMEGADLSGAQMERADLSGVQIEGAVLRWAQMEGAVLRWAQMEGADLGWAQMEGADLGGAQMEGADLREAKMEGVNLQRAEMEGAVLSRVQMRGADLREAKMTGADLREAKMEGANLRWAEMEGADFGGAQMEGVDLGGARLEGADLRWAQMEGAILIAADLRKSNWIGGSNRAGPALAADFRGAEGLMQARLDELIGNADTLLPDNPPTSGAPLYIWSCWETEPPGFDALVASFRSHSGDVTAREAADTFLCGPDNPRHKTGTPWPLDKPRPPGHPLGPGD